MQIVVLLKMVPDVVEDLEIAAGGKGLDLDAVRMILSESDEHALEQALLLKERHGGKVIAVAMDAAEADDALYTALAKGADRALKITGLDAPPGTREAARIVSRLLAEEADLASADLVLTGVQAIDDLDGLLAPLVAQELGLSWLSIVTQVAVDATARTALAMKEYPGGVRGEFEVRLPAVLGIQAAEKPPRYVPVAKIRAAMKSQGIDSVDAPAPAGNEAPALDVAGMKVHEPTAHAEMLAGDPEAAAAALCGILAERGLL